MQVHAIVSCARADIEAVVRVYGDSRSALPEASAGAETGGFQGPISVPLSSIERLGPSKELRFSAENQEWQRKPMSHLMMSCNRYFEVDTARRNSDAFISQGGRKVSWNYLGLYREPTRRPLDYEGRCWCRPGHHQGVPLDALEPALKLCQ